ncbi:Il23r [Columba livia]|nr:Il23r [Columba livia]
MAGSGEALALHILLCCLCRGVATIKCFGHVWIEPSPVVPMGSNISINCRSTLGCPGAKFLILLNYSQPEGLLHPLNSSTIQLWLHDIQVPFRTVICLARCPNSQKHRLVCGTQLLAGLIPALPLVIGAETTDTSPPVTTIRWRRQTLLENVCCEERHKATDTPAWHEPIPTPTLPPTAPAVAPDVWRRLGPAFPNGSHEVTVLIKPLSSQDARGRILGYTVVTKSPGGTQLLCNTSSTACSLLLPLGTHTLHVTAHNTRGASSPATITLGQGTSSQEEFPAPVAVKVKPQNRSGVLVTWQPPRRSRRSPLWFIVEWVSTFQYNHEEQYFWKKVSSQETHTDITEEELAGGPINVSVYAVYPDGVSKPSSSQVPAEEPLLGSTSSHISHDDDIGVFLGLGASMVILSVVLIILMFKKSARKRINATLVSLLPKWLFEDFPHMENSNVVKSLQEKSDFMSHSFHEPLLDTSDPAIMKVEEMPVREEYKNVATRRKPSREVPKDGDRPRSTAPTSITSPEPISDYKPQVSDGNLLGYVAANFYQTQPVAALPEPEISIFFRDYTSPVSQLWDGEEGGHQICLLEKINLILNSSRSGQSQALGSAPGGQGSLLGTQWDHTLASDVQEQTLVPDELVSCLRAMNKESVDIQSCFPQTTERLF